MPASGKPSTSFCVRIGHPESDAIATKDRVLKRRYWVSAGLVAGLALAVAPLVLHIPGDSLLAREVQNIGHVPLFGLITTLLLLLARLWLEPRLSPLLQYGAVLFFSGALGLGTEVAQMVGTRDADFWDLTRNGVGVVLAIGWWATFDRRFDGAFMRRARSRIIVRTVVVVTFLAFFVPLIGVVNAYRERANRFPVLFSFAAPSETRFINTRLAWFEFTPPPGAWAANRPRSAARVVFGPYRGGALVFNEPQVDWTGYDEFVFDVFHPGRKSVELGLRVDDQIKSRSYGDRFNKRIFVEPGFNRVRVPMAEIVAGPADRDLEISLIKRIVIYSAETESSFEIYFGPIGLTSSTSPD